jgi:hypothetical protein
MTRTDTEKVALIAALLGVLIMLYEQLSYHFHLWPK